MVRGRVPGSSIEREGGHEGGERVREEQREQGRKGGRGEMGSFFAVTL